MALGEISNLVTSTITMKKISTMVMTNVCDTFNLRMLAKAIGSRTEIYTSREVIDRANTLLKKSAIAIASK